MITTFPFLSFVRTNESTIMNNSSGGFGGRWTLEKLECVRKYLAAYVKVMMNQPFKTAYIDAFAGTGYTRFKGEKAAPAGMFDDETSTSEAKGFSQGSAQIALEVEPPFGTYIYIEKDDKRAQELEKLKERFPHRADSIKVKVGDANEELAKLCDPKMRWGGRRAVLFLDPYGMQVDWTTIESVGRTKHIDMLFLFPLGMGVMRLLRRDAQISPENAARLTRLFGTSDWRKEFYADDVQPGMFDEPGAAPGKVKVAKPQEVANFWLKRLGTAFEHVSQKGRVLRNSRNSPLYLLCFAAGNPKGRKIMDDIFKKSTTTTH